MSENNIKNYNIRMMYSIGFASLMLSQYKTNLTFGFAPYVGKDNKGIDKYDSKMFISISVSYAEAAALYHISEAIVEGYNKPGEFVLTRNRTTMIFDFKPNQDNQMEAFLVIKKNDRMIPFRFTTQEYTSQENGQAVTTIIQAGLIVFAKALNGYLSGIGVDSPWAGGTTGTYPNYFQTSPSSMGNSNYQKPNWNNQQYQQPPANNYQAPAGNNYQYRPM